MNIFLLAFAAVGFFFKAFPEVHATYLRYTGRRDLVGKPNFGATAIEYGLIAALIAVAIIAAFSVSSDISNN